MYLQKDQISYHFLFENSVLCSKMCKIRVHVRLVQHDTKDSKDEIKLSKSCSKRLSSNILQVYRNFLIPLKEIDSVLNVIHKYSLQDVFFCLIRNYFDIYKFFINQIVFHFFFEKRLSIWGASKTLYLFLIPGVY